MSHPILLDALSREFTNKKRISSSLRASTSPAFGSPIVLNLTQISRLLSQFPSTRRTAHPSEVCSRKTDLLKSTFETREIYIWREAKGPAGRKHRLTIKKEAKIWLAIHQST